MKVYRSFQDVSIVYPDTCASDEPSIFRRDEGVFVLTPMEPLRNRGRRNEVSGPLFLLLLIIAAIVPSALSEVDIRGIPAAAGRFPISDGGLDVAPIPPATPNEADPLPLPPLHLSATGASLSFAMPWLRAPGVALPSRASEPINRRRLHGGLSARAPPASRPS